MNSDPNPTQADNRAVYAVLDVETTGLDPELGARVVEIGIVLADWRGHLVREWSSLVDPGTDVGCSEVHGIVASDLAGAPSFAEIAPDVERCLAGRVAIGHNVWFDLGFVDAELRRAGSEPLHGPAICTIHAARSIGSPGPYGLARCAARFGIDVQYAHRALADARVTAMLWTELLKSGAVPSTLIHSFPRAKHPVQREIAASG